MIAIVKSRARRKSPRGAGAAGKPAVKVDAEERSRLVEDCAYFRAAHYRPAAGPGCVRAADLDAAAADIDAAIKARRKGRKR